MTEERKTILSLEALAIGFRSRRKSHELLPPLNATAAKGEMVALLGRNGIGKSTLLRTIMGLQQKLGGLILIDGKDLSSYSRMELATKAGYISTQNVRASNMTVYDLVALGRFPYTGWMGTLGPGDRKSVEDGISRAGIEHLSSRYISELSDGERQRSMLARVLAQETDIMILDEPTAFLDISAKFEMIHLLSNLAAEGRTIIFSTHDFGIAFSQADKIWLVLDDGIMEGTPEELTANKAFNNLFDPEIARGKRDPHYLKYFL
jgi:iron complex transport system ATP-binding protein